MTISPHKDSVTSAYKTPKYPTNLEITTHFKCMLTSLKEVQIVKGTIEVREHHGEYLSVIELETKPKEQS